METSTTTQAASGGSPAAQILSGGDMALVADVLTNRESQIAANGNLSIAATTATNEGIDLLKTTTSTTSEFLYNSHWEGDWFGCGCAVVDRTGTVTYPRVTKKTTIGAIFGTIEAGGTLSANVSGYLKNNAVRGGAGQIGLTSGPAIASAEVSNSTAATQNDQTGPTAATGPGATVSLDTLNVSITGLTGRKATFAAAASPDVPYVIETRSQFLDPSKFLGSDYFLKQLGGYNPEANLKRLGDAYFEYRLVAEQLFAQTGKNGLSGQNDPYLAMQSLYDNALAQKKALSLTPGIALVCRSGFAP